MIVVAAQRHRPKNGQDLTGALAINPLARLRRLFRRGQARQQRFQQAPSILQQSAAQGGLDPLGAHRLALLQTLAKELQEGLGFLVTLGLDLLEFFYVPRPTRGVCAMVKSANSSARR